MNSVVMMVRTRMISLVRFETIDRWASRAPATSSRNESARSVIRTRWS